MFNLLVSDVMQRETALTLSPDVTVSAAATQMAQRNIGAVMVAENDRLVGIFTERDALYRVIARGLDVHTTPLAAVMTPHPHTVEPTRTYGYALVMMQENGFRHAPVTKDGRPVGIVSSRNAMDPELEEFASEVNRRKFIREGN